MFKNLFVLVSLCALFTTAVASKPAAHLSRESLEKRILDSAAAGTRMLKQFDVRRAPHRDNTHARRQVSALFNEFAAAEQPTQAADSGIFVLAVKTQTAASTLKTGLASRQVDVDNEVLEDFIDSPESLFDEDTASDSTESLDDPESALDSTLEKVAFLS